MHKPPVDPAKAFSPGQIDPSDTNYCPNREEAIDCLWALLLPGTECSILDTQRSLNEERSKHHNWERTEQRRKGRPEPLMDYPRCDLLPDLVSAAEVLLGIDGDNPVSWTIAVGALKEAALQCSPTYDGAKPLIAIARLLATIPEA